MYRHLAAALRGLGLLQTHPVLHIHLNNTGPTLASDFLIAKFLTLGRSCCAAVECSSRDHEVEGSNPTKPWAFFLLISFLLQLPITINNMECPKSGASLLNAVKVDK